MNGLGELRVEYEPRLVEETVFQALKGHPKGPAVRRQRDRLYEIEDAEARDAAFRRFHAAWFDRLGLGEPIDQALSEQPLIAAAVWACLVAFASSDRQEGAELFVRSPQEGMSEVGRRSVVIRLRPETLLAPARIRAFLRHELLHIADMLDPRFGYEPWLPSSDAGPAHRELLKERYRVLWDAYIDGRLSRLGWAPAGTRARRLAEFARAFPMLGGRAEEAFDCLFGSESRRHGELVAFASDPESMIDRSSGGGRAGGCCPLCRFPTHAFEPEPRRLPHAAREAVRHDFPEWDPSAGLCLQCADLYRARSASPSSERLRHAG